MFISPTKNLVFCYGTLKKGFPNFSVMQEIKANFIVAARTVHRYPLIIDGEWNVPFLINNKNYPKSYHVFGELFEVDEHGLMILDDFEGVGMNYYKRLKIQLLVNTKNDTIVTRSAWCYFSYDSRETLLADSSRFLSNYGNEDAEIYTEVQQRPSDWRE